MENSSTSQTNAEGKPSASSQEQETAKKQAESAASDSNASASSPEEGGAFECNICFEPAKDSVVTMCGHLFCWPCISRWLDARGAAAACPVCKSAVSRDRCVPIYGRNADGSSRNDPRNSGASSSSSGASAETPRRPQGQREEPAQNQNPFFFGSPFNVFPQMGAAGNGFNLSFGIGAFPFALFSTFNLGGLINQNGARHNEANGDGQQMENDVVLSRVFLLLAVLFIAWMMVL